MKKICHFWRQFLSLICCIWASARCWLEPACRVKCEGNKNKSFVALTRGNSINKTRPFPADILIVLQRRAAVLHAEILVLAKYREKDRRSPSICRSAAFVIGLAEYLQQTLHDTRGSIFLSLQLSLNIDTMHVLCHLSLCVNILSLSLTCFLFMWQKTDKLYWGRKWFSWWSKLAPFRVNNTRPPWCW